ncbi:MAG TPA: glutamate synthase subunit beta [Gammaproteobacteria bacterium]|nr:glutamate synthase subunit beta [Gammaproteobacteria bacterium]
MFDPQGFLRYPRQEPPRERVRSRLRHWREYRRQFPVGDVVQQARRCMDCGTPWCHGHCPVHNLVPDWNLLVDDGHWRRAWQQLESTNNFPEFTGRLCPAPCEDACTLRLSDQPVTIKAIELAIAERAWANGWVRPQPAARRRRQRVTVVGSGPAGLACAQLLARVGYRVRVLEKDDRPGGLLRYGIPDFRLDKRILDRRLAQLAAEGVVFETGVHAGQDPDAPALLASADALVLACGARCARDLQVPGRDLDGVHLALDYLGQQNRRLAGDRIDARRAIDARGLDVVVVGGGDTGSDCVGTALRQGARSVTQVQYHERPPARLEVLDYWPRPVPVLKLTDTDREGCRHLWGWDTVALEGRAGQVAAVVLQRLQWYRDAAGAWRRRRLPDRQRRLPAQLVLVAIGYAHTDHDALPRGLGLAFDARGNLAADETGYQTSRPGVFACGDARRGQSLLVWAIREGRRCARAVDLHLRGETVLPEI